MIYKYSKYQFRCTFTVRQYFICITKKYLHKTVSGLNSDHHIVFNNMGIMAHRNQFKEYLYYIYILNVLPICL
jgi:hypothetical protein